MENPPISRRALIRSTMLGAVAAFLAACTGRSNEQSFSGAPTGTPATSTPGTTPPVTLSPTPACVDPDDETPAQTEGPYFTRNSPEKTSFRADVRTGERLMLTGTVVSTACVPVDRALVDFWHCDAAGAYDNDGYRLRGHQFTDANGVWKLDTILPGIYPGRTRHIHVKVQAPNKPVLTTQLYFPGESQNTSDGIFREECVITMRDAASGKAGTFTFVLDV